MQPPPSWGSGPGQPGLWSRRVFNLALTLATLGVTALSALRFISLTGPVPAVQALYPLVGAAAVLLALIWALRRSWRGLLLATPAAICALLLSAGSLRTSTVPPGPNDLVVLSLNMYYGEADAEALVAEVKRLNADVLVLPEASSDGIERLDEAGLDEIMPHHAGDSEVEWEVAGATVIRSREPLTVVDKGDQTTFHQPAVRFTHAGRAITLRAVHPMSPGLTHSSEWRADLQGLGRWARAQPQDTPLVMAGDFNASSAHPAFRQASAGMQDAQAATGAGYVRTWPAGRRIPGFVQLDHVLVRGLGVVDAGNFTVPDTDHAGVWARLSLGG